MIFSDSNKERGRLTAPEREAFNTEAQQLGIRTTGEISEGQAVGLVLQKLSNQSPSNAAIVQAIIEQARN